MEGTASGPTTLQGVLAEREQRNDESEKESALDLIFRRMPFLTLRTFAAWKDWD